MNPLSASPARALVVRIGALGDVLLTRRLAFGLSVGGERVSLLAPARHASLLRRDPWIEQILDAESPVFAKAFIGLWPEEPRGFARAIVISSAMELGRAVVAAAGSVRMVSPAPARTDRSIAEQWAEASPHPRGEAPPLPTLPVDPALAVARDLLVIHAGSGSRDKNWSPDRFSSLAERLREAGHQVGWLRGPADAHLPDAPASCVALDGLNLDQLASTLACARGFVGNDSGVAHLSGAVGAPTLAIFGPTSSTVFRPDGPRVRALDSPEGDLEELSVETVLIATTDLLRA